MSRQLYDTYYAAQRMADEAASDLRVECKRIVECILEFFKEDDLKENSKKYWERSWPSRSYLGIYLQDPYRGFDHFFFEYYDITNGVLTMTGPDHNEYDCPSEVSIRFNADFLDMTNEEITAFLDAEFAEKRNAEREKMAETARKRREAKEKRALAKQEKEKALLRELAEKYPDVI